MPDCNYCEDTFEDDAAYLEHLAETHDDELGRIDRRRVETHTKKDAASAPSRLVLGGVVLVALVAVVGLFFALYSTGATDASSDGATEVQQPTDLGSAHYHGTMEMVVLGDQLDFSQNRYQLRADAFHFEGGQGTQWHVHANDVTLKFALESLGFEVTDSTITVDGTTYSDADSDTRVSISVNDEAVSISAYVLQPNDRIRVVVDRT